MSGKDALHALPTLSFSRYLRLKKCFLSGAALAKTRGSGEGRSPRLRSQVVGDILHDVMSDINSTDVCALSQATFRARFNAVVNATHAKLLATSSSRHLGNPNNWPELVAIYRRLVDVVELRRSNEQCEGVVTYAERSLTSRDGLLWGRPDAYFVSQSDIDLVDYKTGSIFEEDGPRQDYEDQLYFYAYLIDQAHGIYPRSLSLSGPDGNIVSLPPSVERSQAVASNMLSVLEQHNRLAAQGASLEELATPASASCLFCERKLVCERFWHSLPVLETPPWNHVAIGLQSTPLARTARGGGWFELAVEKSSLSVRTLKVARVFDQRFPAVDLEHRVGQRLLLTGLRRSEAANPVAAELTDRSTIVCLEAPTNGC